MIALLFSYLFMSVANIVIGFFKRKSAFLFSVTLVLIFILMAFNYDGPDINAYMNAYNEWFDSNGNVIFDGFMEPGYQFLMIIGRKIGLSFFAFRTILTIVCLFLFINIIKYYKANGNLVIGFYMLYLFFFDAIQIRNFIAQLIILFAIRFIFDKSLLST